MPVHVLVTGPIRPSLDAVLNLHSQAKRYFPGCTTHLVYWSTTPSDHEILAKTFDHVKAYQEPTDSFIDSVVTSRTVQIQHDPINMKRHHYNLYKQYLATRYMSQFVDIPDSDVVVKLRTDTYLLDVDILRLAQFLDTIDRSAYYVNPRPVSAGNGVCDAFGITTFGVYKTVWGVSDTTYNFIFNGAWNSENAVRKCLEIHHVPTRLLPENTIRFSLCRQYSWVTHLELFW